MLNMINTPKKDTITFIEDIEKYFQSNDTPYIISDSSGLYCNTNNDKGSTEKTDKSSLLGVLQSVAVASKTSIMEKCNIQECGPIISYIGNNQAVITTEHNRITISYIEKTHIDFKETNFEKIYDQISDMAGINENKPTQNTTINDIHIDTITDDVSTSLATIHGVRDMAFSNTKRNIKDNPITYIPFKIKDTHYIIVSKYINNQKSIKTIISKTDTDLLKSLNDSDTYNEIIKFTKNNTIEKHKNTTNKI